MPASYRIVFMGTPDFAVPALHALSDAGHEILCVITQPDRPKGRGKKMQAPPVKTAAMALHLPVLQPESMKTDEIHAHLQSLAPDFFVVVAYGHILSERVLAIPKIAPINIHASLLPRYRGAAPIQWAIIHGEPMTGVTTMFMDKGMDTGDMIEVARTEILPTDTTQTLHDRLSEMGGKLILSTIEGMGNRTLTPEPQNHENATVAPMLKKTDGEIDWNTTMHEIDCRVRGVSPWPGAYTFLDGGRIKIFEIEKIPDTETVRPGTVLESFPGELRVACKDGQISITSLQGASGKRLSAADYLRGHAISPGTLLGTTLS